jgi:hypothetical protein
VAGLDLLPASQLPTANSQRPTEPIERISAVWELGVGSWELAISGARDRFELRARIIGTGEVGLQGQGALQ